MKINVVVAYYQPTQHENWPSVVWGLNQNAEYIDKVFVVNDGAYGDKNLVCSCPPLSAYE